MPCRIEAATLEQMEHVRRIGREVYRETFAPFNTEANMRAYLDEAYNLPALQAAWAEPGAVCFLSWDGDEPTGFMHLRNNNEAEPQLGSRTLELQRLYLRKPWQGVGVGNRFMDVALAEARSRGVEWIWLGVWERNFRAQAFYKKWGFEKFGEHIFQMGDDPQTDWLLCRRP
jgi:ribosomal protein S18 acetylase RimI-like enzyme